MGVTLHQLLKTLVDQAGTDLHITTNSPPQIRIDGRLVPLQLPPMSAAETSRGPWVATAAPARVTDSPSFARTISPGRSGS